MALMSDNSTYMSNKPVVLTAEQALPVYFWQDPFFSSGLRLGSPEGFKLPSPPPGGAGDSFSLVRPWNLEPYKTLV